MKSEKLLCITTMTLFAALAIPVRLAAQEQKEGKEHHRYKLVDLGTLGGPHSFTYGGTAQALNNRRTVVGQADTSIPDPNYPNFSSVGGPDPFLQHGFQWQNGVLTDLGALPGANSSGADWVNSRGIAVGGSTNGAIDPLTGMLAAVAVLWADGQIINLGTLGSGYESGANAINDRGQVVGGATNAIPDPFSIFYFQFLGFSSGTQTRAFLWQNGHMQDLGTLGGPDAFATAVNERGQIMGASYINSTPNPVTGLPTRDGFLWENGKMIDLGTLGGTLGGGNWLNNRGQVAGTSNLAGDLTFHPFLWTGGVLRYLGTFGGNFGAANWVNDAGEVVGWTTNEGDQALLAFLWEKGVMTNLGTLQGDDCSLATNVNSGGQIVGSSFPCAGGSSHAFLWERGAIIDLNTFALPGSNLQLTEATFINDRGEIAGNGVLPNGDTHAFLLIPCDENHFDAEGCRDASDAAPVTQNSTSVTTGRLTPEMLAAFRARFGRMHGFGAWRRK